MQNVTSQVMFVKSVRFEPLSTVFDAIDLNSLKSNGKRININGLLVSLELFFSIHSLDFFFLSLCSFFCLFITFLLHFLFLSLVVVCESFSSTHGMLNPQEIRQYLYKLTPLENALRESLVTSNVKPKNFCFILSILAFSLNW